jgi:hypothetical protein
MKKRKVTGSAVSAPYNGNKLPVPPDASPTNHAPPLRAASSAASALSSMLPSSVDEMALRVQVGSTASGRAIRSTTITDTL